jgi:predicted ATPase/class 3 adenylate cyclase
VAELPSGTVTFLFTDIEGSTSLWQDHPEAMTSALARHDLIVREAIEAHDGYVVKTTGDGFHAAFAAAHDAIDAAVAVQLTLAAELWEETGPLRVRAGIHSGPAELREGDYYGTAVNRAARLMSVAHGGQVVVSLSTSELVRDGSFELVSLGEHRLKGLTDVERVFQVTAPGLAREFPPLQSLDAFPGNLPRQVTTFVGREAEITSIAKLVRESSLVTLTGVGGVGKTRLSLEVAAEVAPEFSGGAWLCEFAPVADPGAVWETLAATLRVQSSTGRSLEESVLEYLALKRLLLVLDNCEHLLSAIANMVDAIIRRCPQVSILATSREGLGLGGERMVAVPSLAVPAADADIRDLCYTDAVRLFEDRASAAKLDFAVTDRNARAVAVLCRRLDGIPLAIELAAARVRSMSPDDLVTRLDQRFKLLTKGSRAALERQQTLRATIDWSYDLLDPIERQVLDRLSVFAGGCDLDAAEVVVAGDDLEAFEVDDVLSQLVDKSLVVADDTDQGVRYRLLETIRQYAQERLEAAGSTHTARAAHANYFAALAESNRAALRGHDQFLVAQHLAGETDNFRTAIDYSVDTHDADLALRLVAPLAVRGPSVGYAAMGWAEAAIGIPHAARHALFPEVASWATWSATARRDLPLAGEYAAKIDPAEAELGRQIAAAQRGPAVLAFFSGDYERARVKIEEAVVFARRDGDTYELAMALILLAAAHDALGNHVLALQTCEEAVQVARDAGTSTLAMGLNLLASLLPEESERAFSVLDEAFTIGHQIGDPVAVSTAVGFKAWFAVSQGNNALALELARDAIEREVHAGLTFAIGRHLLVAAVALTGLERFEPAALLLGTGPTIMPGQGAERAEQLVSRAEIILVEQLGRDRYDTLRHQGADLSLDDVIATLGPTPEDAP